jgi:hypothetical protein
VDRRQPPACTATIKLPPELKYRAEDAAYRQGLRFSEFVRRALADAVARDSSDHTPLSDTAPLAKPWHNRTMILSRTSSAAGGAERRCAHPRAVAPVERHGSSVMIKAQSFGPDPLPMDPILKLSLVRTETHHRATNSVHRNPKREKHHKCLASAREDECITNITMPNPRDKH